jgi:hypothetical protein
MNNTIFIELWPLTKMQIFEYRYEFKMNLKTSEVTQRLLSTLTIEFPRINDNYIGR